MLGISYFNFDIALDKVNEIYRARVFTSPSGQAKATTTLAELLVSQSNLDASSLDFKKLGSSLFKAVFSDEVYICLMRSLDIVARDNSGLRIRLRLNDVPELAGLPWEYLYDASCDRAFSLSVNTPIIRYLELAQAEQPLNIKLPLKLIVVIANPNDLQNLDIEKEWQQIRDALGDLEERGLLELHKLEQATLSVLQKQLRQKEYHILHFIGHGWSGADTEDSGLVFEDESKNANFITAQQLGTLLYDHKSIRLVFLNACESARTKTSDALAGTAQRLVMLGLPAVIAMQSVISDQASIILSHEFYRAIADNYEIDAALAEARKAVFEQNLGEWGVPVLFSRSQTNRLFDLIEEESLTHLDIFAVKQSEIARIQNIYVEPSLVDDLLRVRKSLTEHHFLLISGPVGVGKRSTAVNLAMDLIQAGQVSRILRVFRPIPFDELYKISRSVIILPDIFGLFRWEYSEVAQDIIGIERLITSNYVIMTSNEEVLEEMFQETRLSEWDLMWASHLPLSTNSYNYQTRMAILDNHLAWSLKEGRISSSQKQWFESKAYPIIAPEVETIVYNKWLLPVDIKTFVDTWLPKLRDEEELLSSLRQADNLELEVRNWFENVNNDVLLRDDLQCFLFVLSLFSGFERQELWGWYRKLVLALKSLNRSLTIRPFGVLINETKPYVIDLNGAPTFAHASLQQAILNVIAISYREYFLELLEEFRKAIVPELGKDKTQNERMVVTTQRVRNAVTLAASAVAQNNIYDVLPLVNSLADIKKGRVRISAAEILSSAASNRTQLNSIFEILQNWTSNRSDEAVARRWTAVITYGKLGHISPEKAIRNLEDLADDANPYVRSGVPMALQTYVDTQRKKSKKVMTRLAADANKFTRREVSNVLRILCYRNIEFVAELLTEWISLSSPRRLWTLARTCMIIPRALKPQRIETLIFCLNYHIEEVQQAIVDVLQEGDISPREAWALMESLVVYSEDIATKLVPIATLIESRFSEISWEYIYRWAHHSRSNLRISAAYILTHWKTDFPEKAQPLLALLASDINYEVSYAAQLEPIAIVSRTFYEEVVETESGRDSQNNSDNDFFDFETQILG